MGQGQKPQNEDRGAAGGRPQKPRQAILVVDDLPANRHILKVLLAHAGYDVMSASNGREALELVETEPPDLILLDVVMPVMSGTEVLRTLKRRDDTRMIPIVLLSVQSEVADRVGGLEEGADDYIGKPYNHEELLAKIKALLKIRDLNEQLRQAEKLAVLAQVAVSVNHQVNNPLSSILYGADLLEMMVGNDTTEVREQLRVIRESVEQIKTVMARLRGATEVVPVQYLRDIQMLEL
jgi:two-component system, sensor histidine kinase and response regulator